MGLFVVLIFYAIVFSIIGGICAIVLVFITHIALRKTNSRRKRVYVTAGVLPFACLVFAGCWFIAYMFMNYGLFHRDPMLGDGWFTPMPNGYSIEMIDVTNVGTVHKTNLGLNSYSKNPADEISGVVELQLSGPFMYGSIDKNWFNDLSKDSFAGNAYFLVDTKSNTYQGFSSYSELENAAALHKTKLQLQPIDSVYNRYRFTWFDFTAGFILFLVPAVALFFFVRYIWMMRKAGLAEIADETQSVAAISP